MHTNIKDRSIDIFFLSICLIASGFFSIYLGQDSNWDLRNYHFYNAHSFLNNRLTYDIAPAQIQTFLNPLLDIPFYIIIKYLKPIYYGFIVGAVQGINIWLVYKITSLTLIHIPKIQRYLLSIAAGVTGYYGAANISEIGTNFNDNITSLFVLGGLFLILRSIKKGKNAPLSLSTKALLASGLLLGCSAGLKLTTIVYFISMIFSLLLIGPAWNSNIKNAFISGIGFIVGFMTSIGHWMVLLWQNFNNPIFPFYNKFFKSPYYALSNFVDNRFFPHDKYQTLFYPFYFIKRQTLVSEVRFRDIRLAVCYILFALLIFIIFYNWVNRKFSCQEPLSCFGNSDHLKKIYTFIIVFFVFSYILWQCTFSIYRYIIPLELLSPVFIMIIIQYIFPFNKIYIPLSLGIFALIIVTMVPMHWGRVPWTKDYFDFKMPPIENVANSTIIMAGYDPLAYIVPFFPENTRFVRIQSNFFKPSSNTLLQVKVREALQNSKSLYILSKEKRLYKEKVDYDKILKLYNLKIVKQNFKKLSTRFDNDLILFPLSPLN